MQKEVLRDCHELFDLMREFWAAFGRQMNATLVPRRLNIPQYMAMVVLRGADEVSMGGLSQQLGVTMGASTNIVDKLLRAGYVSRRRGTEDRRTVKVRLEDKGREVVGQIEEDAGEFVAGLLAQIGPERGKQFIEQYGEVVASREAGERA